MSDLQFEEHQPTTPLQLFFRILLGIAILGMALTVSVYWIKNKKRAKHKAPAVNIPLVNATRINIIDHPVIIAVMGSIIPKQQTNLTPQVSGKVTATHLDLIPGKILNKGAVAITIDPRDYQNILAQRQSDLVRIQAELKLEMGRQKSAKRSFKLLNEKVSHAEKSLILRQPQLKSVRASLKAAQAALAKANLDLTRTKVLAPFNAIILSKDVSTGVNVNPNSRLATLVDTDEYWIEVAIPQDQLSLIKLNQPDKPITAKVHINNHQIRMGTVLSIKPQVINNGRMAQAVIAIKDPLALLKKNAGKGKLLLGNFIKVEIMGDTLKGVIAIPYNQLHDNSQVWLLKRDGSLSIRKVKALISDKKFIYISKDEIKLDEKIITSHLAVPVDQMKLRTRK